jgi:flavin reductase (DIM6/NTAB) family NADH-FMN oxidoreductase RutF
MRKITLDNTSKRDFHQYMLGSVVPRPIALVSTVSEGGVRNIAPYSYFNAVSSIPPILMVSVGRKGDSHKKDTLVNVEETGEFVVNMVPFSMIRQMALTSVMLPPESDEYNLSGLTGIDSIHIRPQRIEESPIHFECKLNRILTLGSGPAESTLIFGDVQCIHIDEKIIDERNRIDPTKLDIVGRLGRSYYTRVEGSSLETVVMPQREIPLGFEVIPESIRKSEILSANDLASLASLYQLPSQSEIKEHCENYRVKHPNFSREDLHRSIKTHIQLEQKIIAWSIALGLS